MITKAFGDKAVLIPVDNSNLVPLISAWIKTILPVNKYRVLNGLDSILVEATDPLLDIYGDVTNALASFNASAEVSQGFPEAKEVDIPCIYDGEDLIPLSKTLGLSSEELIKAHKNILWRVALVGFSPGFPYMVPINDSEGLFANIARLDTPRKLVPAGSVALAAGMSAIYPSNMPGGWNLIGRTSLSLFDVDKVNPSTLSINDTIQFREVK